MLSEYSLPQIYIFHHHLLYLYCIYPRKYTLHGWELDDSVLDKFRVILDDVALSHCHFPRGNVLSLSFFFSFIFFMRYLSTLYLIVRISREFTGGMSTRKMVNPLAAFTTRAHRPYLCTRTWVACRNKSSLARHLAFLR